MKPILFYLGLTISLFSYCNSLFIDRENHILHNTIQHFQVEPFRHPDLNLTVIQLITKYGYPVEEHEIVTKDGYILTAYRIPHGRNPENGIKNRQVVWLQHGLFTSCADWIMLPFDEFGNPKSLAYILADAGYDVWLGNARGNTFSRRHLHLDPDIDKAEFWNFSWHEMGVFDVPAVIDHALSISGQSKLFWVGHSMGSTMFLIGMSTHPQYNNKIHAMFGLGPAANIGNTISPVALLAPISYNIEKILKYVGVYEFFPSSDFLKMLGTELCHDESPFQEVCTNIVFLICGFNNEQVNGTQLPLIMTNVPAGSSARTVVHYAQVINANSFRMFNHGREKNLILYGQPTPPVYDLSKITAPVSLHYGDNDWLTTPEDVIRIAEEVSNPIGLGHERVPNDQWSHIDFIWAKDAKTILYNRLLEMIKEF